MGPKLIYYKKNRIDKQNIRIKKCKKAQNQTLILFKTLQLTIVFVASVFSENETPAKAKRGFNKEYDTYNEAIEDIKTGEIIGMVYRRTANDQHEYVFVKSIPTDPDDVFVIVISYKINNNNKIKIK